MLLVLCTIILAGLVTGRTPQQAAPRRSVGAVPDVLLPCYENATLYESSSRLQPSMGALLALIGKVERAGYQNVDMRSLSASLIHRFRLDGIERDPEVPNDVPGIVPFASSGRQFTKYQVLFSQLVPPANIFPEDALQDFEKCALHFMLSSSVRPWQRGDEHEVCPLTLGGRSRTPQKPKSKPRSWSEWPSMPDEEEQTPRRSGAVSRCPIEEGVVWTKWGAVSAGTLLAGIAASLQPQKVPLASLLWNPTSQKDEIPVEPVDNIWGATLAGDLAEVAVYQGPRAFDASYLRLGPGGSWNDSALPRMLYFDPWTGTQGGWEQESWDITEAELRGGIDGLVLGSRVQRWIDRFGSLRLSQLLDMYYSERGIAMDMPVRACRRADLEAEAVLVPTLRAQTESFARVLTDHTSTVPIAPSALAKFSKSAVDSYIRFAESVLLRDSEFSPCSENTSPQARVELLTVFDGTYTTWEGQRVVNVLERYSDISSHGSAIAVMDGWTGYLIANFTRLSTYTVRKLEDPLTWPTGLNLELTVRGARKALQRRRALDARRGESVSANSRGTVVLVLANTATNSEAVLKNAAQEMAISKEIMPDVTWLFVTSQRRDDYESLVDDPTRDIITAKEGDLESYMPALIRRLRQVPGRILPAMCPSMVQDSLAGLPVIEWVPVQPRGPHYEDHVTPGEMRLYRVPSALLIGTSKVKITLRASDYGDLVACISRAQPGIEKVPPPFPKVALDDEERCDAVMANSETRFYIDNPCKNTVASSCRPLFLWLTVQKTNFKCTEAECRFPDQVRFSMWHEGLRPLPGCGSPNSAFHLTPSKVWLSLLLIMTIIKQL